MTYTYRTETSQKVRHRSGAGKEQTVLDLARHKTSFRELNPNRLHDGYQADPKTLLHGKGSVGRFPTDHGCT